MPFINEYIPEADKPRYEAIENAVIKRTGCVGHSRGRSWTIDRERDIFLTYIKGGGVILSELASKLIFFTMPGALSTLKPGCWIPWVVTGLVSHVLQRNASTYSVKWMQPVISLNTRLNRTTEQHWLCWKKHSRLNEVQGYWILKNVNSSVFWNWARGCKTWAHSPCEIKLKSITLNLSSESLSRIWQLTSLRHHWPRIALNSRSDLQRCLNPRKNTVAQILWKRRGWLSPLEQIEIYNR